MMRIAAFCLALFVIACSVPPALPQSNEAIVYVIERDWHTDIGLPVNEITGPLTKLEERFPGVQYLTFGFGERTFVVDHRQDLRSMLGAMLPSKSTLLMTALRGTPQEAFGKKNVVVLHVSRVSLDRIVAAVTNELERSPAGEPILLGMGPYNGSMFYAARDTYYGLFTCNTWTAKTLREAGLPITEASVLFSGQVMGPVRWLAAHRTQPTVQ